MSGLYRCCTGCIAHSGRYCKVFCSIVVGYCVEGGDRGL